MLSLLVAWAGRAGVLDRLVVVHADLGRAEWEGTGELAALQAALYGLPFEVVKRKGGDLVDQIEAREVSLKLRAQDAASVVAGGIETWSALRDAPQDLIEGLLDEVDGRPRAERAKKLIRAGKVKARKHPEGFVDFGAPVPWPSASNRYCTSDQKRDQVGRVIRRRAKEIREERGLKSVKVLNCMGLRAQESNDRAKRPVLSRNGRLTAKTGFLIVDEFLPIHGWTIEQVWAVIHASGVPYHRAYDLGMPRLSCSLCILAPKAALELGGRHNRPLLSAYATIERRSGYSFRSDVSLIDIEAEIEAEPSGDAPQETVESWSM